MEGKEAKADMVEKEEQEKESEVTELPTVLIQRKKEKSVTTNSTNSEKNLTQNGNKLTIKPSPSNASQ